MVHRVPELCFVVAAFRVRRRRFFFVSGGGGLRHEEFDVARAHVVTILLLNGALGFGPIREADDGLARWTAVVVAVDLNALRTQLDSRQQRSRISLVGRR